MFIAPPVDPAQLPIRKSRKKCPAAMEPRVEKSPVFLTVDLLRS
jgi:hypothetical protein